MSAKEDYIIANRLLVLDFLLSAQKFLREPEGEIKVTVKDVHPYTLWRGNALACRRFSGSNRTYSKVKHCGFFCFLQSPTSSSTPNPLC